MSISKAELRRQIRSTLAELPDVVRRESDDALFSHLLVHTWMREANHILAFYGVGTEPATHSLIAQLLAQGKRISLPKVVNKTTMVAYEIQDLETLSKGALGIPEPSQMQRTTPEQVDLILVPNLCCDREGYRLGQGGGYYDRYLVGYHGHTIALCRNCVLQTQLSREAHDVPIDIVLTEKESWPNEASSQLSSSY